MSLPKYFISSFLPHKHTREYYSFTFFSRYIQSLILSSSFVFLVILLQLYQPILSQCNSNLISNTFTPSLPFGKFYDICPVGYANNNGKCETFESVWNSKLGSSCNVTSDCKFTSMSCVKKKCIAMGRMIGDSCVDASQCVVNVLDMYDTATCYQSKCKLAIKKKKAGIGQACNTVSENDDAVVTCDDGVCPPKLTPDMEQKCVKISTARKGETCGFNVTFSPTTSVTGIVICETGTICSEKILNGKCKTQVKRYQKCDPKSNDQMCYGNLVCRKRTADSIDHTCEYRSNIGEYCEEDKDCAFTNTQMVSCENSKCIRARYLANGQPCTNHTQCYSSFCDPSSKLCSGFASKRYICNTKANSCNSISSQGCACGGKELSTNSSGLCVASCTGAFNDLHACLYNLGLVYYFNILPLPQYLGFTQFADEESSAFRLCRSYYNKFYSCMKKTWIDAGISANGGSIPGVTLDAGLDDGQNVVMPFRNAAPSLWNGRGSFVVQIWIMTMSVWFLLLVVLNL
ncbi:hypothetical protein FDP41_009824 [Naegleria fowleri]|uniref:Uncharacterized protein n=1 Tax=Naegleria fowleri TaxID=5763 RepID=A0A6A5BDW7_NAEFO|nr:uncharacterized protein FDP41_009824 [Naegleria fowleri]KAF0972128.1 hypothetical protein FDP41_009824 [Naegleria fowleri]CAG4712060.1 unnamed protein product [Naegleria fowleri]